MKGDNEDFSDDDDEEEEKEIQKDENENENFSEEKYTRPKRRHAIIYVRNVYSGSTLNKAKMLRKKGKFKTKNMSRKLKKSIKLAFDNDNDD